MLQFPTLRLVGVQNENFTLRSNPVFVSRTKFPVGLGPAKFGPRGKHTGVPSNVLRSHYQFVSHSQLQRPRHCFGCILFPGGRKNPSKYDAPLLCILNYSPQMVCLFKWSTGSDTLSASQKAEGGCVPGICEASWLC